ncbi:polyphosphate:AMP phosphotransferase [Acetobacterium sp.]|uniref:polyphosphate:AMP phosphotransferase n=1 Tax=Acetobacterium sp. TaxID=1872094 RepID=UPI002F41CF8D
MLEKIDLNVTIDKAAYRSAKEALSNKLGVLQRKVFELKIPVLIIFEGWDAAGKGTLINELLMPLDPRNVRVHNLKNETYEEFNRPFLWRYWSKSPEKGQITIFNRSYYSDLEYRQSLDGVDLQGLMNHVNEFERTMRNDGMIIFKFFVHISQEEQKKRFEKLQKKDATAWRVTPRDKDENKHYKKLLEKVNQELELSDKNGANWTIIEGHQKDYATIKVLNTLATRLEKEIKDFENAPKIALKPLIHDNDAQYDTEVLDHVSLDQTMTGPEYAKALNDCQKKLYLLENEIYLRRIPLVIAFEGWDAAGKGGAIKRLSSNLDPRGYTVYPTGSPNDIEKKHHYLWRFWRDVPKNGHISIWDRSWYGRVMVEPIEGLCMLEEYSQSFQEINEFEKQLSDWGAIVIKFWLHIDEKEQLKRFTERQNNPEKQWKITEEDWRNREKWGTYKIAVNTMLLKTSTSNAPWIIVEAQNKEYARIKVLKEVIAAIETKLGKSKK